MTVTRAVFAARRVVAAGPLGPPLTRGNQHSHGRLCAQQPLLTGVKPVRGTGLNPDSGPSPGPTQESRALNNSPDLRHGPLAAEDVASRDRHQLAGFISATPLDAPSLNANPTVSGDGRRERSTLIY